MILHGEWSIVKKLFPRVKFIYVFSMEKPFKVNGVVLKFYSGPIVSKSDLEIIMISLKLTNVWYLLQVVVCPCFFEQKFFNSCPFF